MHKWKTRVTKNDDRDLCTEMDQINVDVYNNNNNITQLRRKGQQWGSLQNAQSSAKQRAWKSPPDVSKSAQQYKRQ